MKRIIPVLLLFISTYSFSQTDTTKPFSFSGYGEFYYSYDFSNPQNHLKPNFIYSHKRHNEFNLNLAYAKAAYNKNNVRANLALMAGNYAQYNLSTEPAWAQFIYEANVGFKLATKHNFWLDVGIMPSHIGFESAVSSDCWNLTRSILAENSPYYETGIKVSYTNKKENFNVSFLVLNGWQKIQKPDYTHKPSFGIQLNYKPTKKITLNYSNFIGTDKPDSLNALRLFHNLYAIFEPSDKIGFTVGFDIGTDKYNVNDYIFWYSSVFITRFKLNNKFKIAARVEYYNDKKQIIIATSTLNGFKTFGTSLNLDYKINNKLLWRIEGKYYKATDKIFTSSSANANNTNSSITTSLAIKF